MSANRSSERKRSLSRSIRGSTQARTGARLLTPSHVVMLGYHGTMLVTLDDSPRWVTRETQAAAKPTPEHAQPILSTSLARDAVGREARAFGVCAKHR